MFSIHVKRVNSDFGPWKLFSFSFFKIENYHFYTKFIIYMIQIKYLCVKKNVIIVSEK